MKTYTSSSDSIRWKGGGGLINPLQPKLISLFIQSDVRRCTVGRCALVILSTCQSQLASSAPNTQRLLKAWESWWQPQPVTEITSCVCVCVCVCLCVCSCCWMPRSVSLQRHFADCRYACVMCWSWRSSSACPTAQRSTCSYQKHDCCVWTLQGFTLTDSERVILQMRVSERIWTSEQAVITSSYSRATSFCRNSNQLKTVHLLQSDRRTNMTSHSENSQCEYLCYGLWHEKVISRKDP